MSIEKSKQNSLLKQWLSSYTIELTTADFKNIDKIQSNFPQGTTAFIAHIRDKSVEELFALAKELKKIGMNPVPHLAARNIKSEAELEAFLIQVEKNEITEVLALGGGINPPIGQFSSVEQMLNTGLFSKHGVKTVGIAGHPEKHPDVDEETLLQALVAKQKILKEQNLDSYIITQFAFDTAPFILFLEKLREREVLIPVRVGIAGVTALKALIKYAAFCGVGNSLQVLKNKASSMTTLLLGYEPDSFWNPLLEEISEEDSKMLLGIHFYLFGNLKKTADFCSSFLNQLNNKS